MTPEQNDLTSELQNYLTDPAIYGDVCVASMLVERSLEAITQLQEQNSKLEATLDAYIKNNNELEAQNAQYQEEIGGWKALTEELEAQCDWRGDHD